MLAPIADAPTLAAQGSTLVVTSTADSGLGTLRQAILNAHSGDIITFNSVNFPPDAPATIYLTKVLPVISQGNLTIDASNAGVILDGSSIVDTPGGWIYGLHINSNGNIVQGLQIINFSPAAGILLSNGAQNNIIGGDRNVGSGPLGQGNLVGKVNTGIGLQDDGTSFNTVRGNLIGTDPAGTGAWGNGIGVHILRGASHNVIGPDNIIAYNDICGIEVQGSNSVGNTIFQNSIHDNKGVDINLYEGGNTELPAPTITDFDVSTGTLSGSAGANYVIEIFSDSSNEGRIYEGQTTADSSGFFSFSKGTPLAGPNVTATATDADGNTSGFSTVTFDTNKYGKTAPVPRGGGKTTIVTSTADSGPGTLRQAMLDAQSGDTITFDPAVFPPDKPATIYFETFLKTEDLNSALPSLNQGNITIDASNAGVILDGSKISGDRLNCLEVHSNGNIIQGLQIINFNGFGLYVGRSYNVIGGDRSIGAGPIGQGNLVGNNRGGIDLFAKASYNTVAGNLVGTDVTGTRELGNNVWDIWTETGAISLEAEANHNTIGPDNIIAFNNGHGIAIIGPNTAGNTITQNSIYDNEGKGIHLLDRGMIELPAPIITDFDLAAGTVSGSAGAGLTIEIFSDSGNEGRIYEGQATADSSGFFSFSKGASLAGPNLTATATDADGNTSAFSRYASTIYKDRIVTGDEVWQDETITTYKMITVKSGASLTLRNVTLTFESPIDEECSIIAEPGSSLAIYSSTLSRPKYSELDGFHIHVENASFVMKDSVLDGASHDCPPVYKEWGWRGATAALTLDHVRGAVIEGNEFKHIPVYAMIWHDVSDSVFTNNAVTPLLQVQNFPRFLDIWDSDNNTITDNYITGVARFITMNNRSTGNYVAGNEFAPFRAGHVGMGITLTEDSNNNIFIDNKILGPSGCTPFRIFTRNNVITNNTMRDFRYGVVLAAGADGNIIASNDFSHMYEEDAIFAYRASGNYIINNHISSSIRGISLTHFSRNNIIQANTISNSRQGILISSSSDDNLIVNNKVSGNKVGITVFKSSGNKIYDNSFIGNFQQGYDDGVNIWSLENRGNYWSDYRREGDIAYDIAPAGIDEHPLAESVPVVAVQVPEPAPLTFREICIPPSQAIKGEVKYENTEILMENSYWIPQGGTLILENVTLRSYKEAAAPYEIKVEGSLIISNSRIIATETGIAPITIRAEQRSTLVIKDSEFHHVGDVPSGGAITVCCDDAVVEGNLIIDSFTGVWLEGDVGASSARILNNTFEGCFEAVWLGDPFVGHLIEGSTIIDPVPAELVSSFWGMLAVTGYRILLYWLRQPWVISGLSVIVIGVITLVWFLIRRRRRRKAIVVGTG